MAITKRYSNKKGTRSAHYDTSGNKVLSSHHSSNGRVKHYDGNGKYLGSTREGGYGRVHHYDENGRRTGTSYIKPSGSVRHFPANTRSDSFESGNAETSSFHASAPLSSSRQNNAAKPAISAKPEHSPENDIKFYPLSTYISYILAGCFIGFILGAFLAFLANTFGI